MTISMVTSADTTIDVDTTFIDDALFQDETVNINANISCIGNSTISFLNCQVQLGITDSASSASVVLSDNASLTIMDSYFSNYDAASSYFLSIDSTGTVVIQNSTFLDNSGSDLNGVLSIRRASVSIDGSLFQGNSGGLFLSDMNSALVSNVTIVSNGAFGLKIINCRNTTVRDSALKDHREGLALDIMDCAGFAVIRSVFSDNNIGIRSSGKNLGLIVSDCDFLRNSGYAIRINGHAVAPGPLVMGCTFTEDKYGISASASGGVSTPWAVESLTISDCSFRFVDIGIDFVGDDWRVLNNTFSYCLAGMYIQRGETIRVHGNTFEDSISSGILIDGNPSDNRLHPIIAGNIFEGGSGNGISVYMGGDIVIDSNMFNDLRGGCLFIFEVGQATMMNNTFSDSPLGIHLWDTSMTVRDLKFIRCDVGIRCDFGNVEVVNTSFTTMVVVVSVEDGSITLTSGTILDGGGIELSRSRLDTGIGFSLGSVEVTMANGSGAVVKDNPTIVTTTWSLDGSSVLDIFNISPEFAIEFLDPTSMVGVWWPVRVAVSWLSNGFPVEGANLVFHDSDYTEIASSSTDPSGLTDEMDILEHVITRDLISDRNPYTITVGYGLYDMELIFEVVGPQTCDVILDDVAPLLELDSPGDGEVLGSGSIEIVGTVFDDSYIASLMLIIDDNNTLISSPASQWKVYVSLGAGIHDIVIHVEDVWKNHNRLEFSLFVDLDPPFIEVIKPLEGSFVTADYLNVVGSTDPLIDVEINGVATRSNQDGSFNVTIPLTLEGLQEVIIVTIDGFGRMLKKRVFITVDWTPPVIHLAGDPLLVNSTEPTLHGSVSEQVKSLSVQDRDVSVSENNSFALDLVLWEGLNYVNWTCVDTAGNLNKGIIRIRVDTQLNLTITKPFESEEIRLGYMEISGITDPLTRVVMMDRGLETISGPDGKFTVVVWSGATGENTLVIEAIDDAGNIRSIEVPFIVIDINVDGEPEPPIYLILVTIAFIVLSLVIGILYFRGRRDGHVG